MKLLLALLAVGALAHNAHPVKPSLLSWQEWHMQQEHQLDSFDADTFFALHDLTEKGYWSLDDILYIYGLNRDTVVGDGSGMGDHDHAETISEETRVEVINSVSELLKADKGKVTKEQWLEFAGSGGVLPDFGLGPGHHKDFEAEYENHHWNKYHRDQDPDVLVKHKEDIEHELLHHEHEIEESHNDKDARQKVIGYVSPVNVKNIPDKYRRA